jgi:DNA-binding NarL/FixJ family response regulator
MVNRPLRIAVVSPNTLIRTGLGALIGRHPHRALLVDSSASDGHLAHLDLVILDLLGLGENPAGELRHLVADNTAVVVLVLEPRSSVVESALAAGAVAALPMSLTSEELVQELERAAMIGSRSGER